MLNAPTGEDAEAAERPPTQWMVIGALLVLTFFFPSSLLAVWIGERLATAIGLDGPSAAALAALPVILAFALSAWSAGALGGRFGLRTRERHGRLAGALGALGVLGLALVGASPPSPLVTLAAGTLLIALGVVSAGLGARYGIRRRPS